ESVGQSTRPSVKFVSCFTCPPFGSTQMFCAPERSDIKKTFDPSAVAIGHICFAPPWVSRVYLSPLFSQISLSSRWLLPFRHHCPAEFPRAAKTTEPSESGEASNSAV